MAALEGLRAVTAENFVAARGLGDMANLAMQAISSVTDDLVANVAPEVSSPSTPGR